MRIKQFLKKLNELPFNSKKCNSGDCFNMAKLLRHLFPGGTIEWDEGREYHVVYRFEGVCYDASGVVSDAGYEPMTETAMRKAARWNK